ncbi:Rieske 2Fe-2S domain-containing protein, partial [Frankia sp. Cpl3]|nr:Rieske 2Fe-2S domain-containing protein [Frankia sp. Cpl3]
MIAFTVGNEQIAVARVGERVFAVEDRCSHADCALSEGLLEDTVVMCPCHAAGFELSTGEPTNLPAEEQIRCFTVTVE